MHAVWRCVNRTETVYDKDLSGQPIILVPLPFWTFDEDGTSQRLPVPLPIIGIPHVYDNAFPMTLLLCVYIGILLAIAYALS